MTEKLEAISRLREWLYADGQDWGEREKDIAVLLDLLEIKPYEVTVQPVAWLRPNWREDQSRLSPVTTYRGLSPVTTYRIVGWIPLVPADNLARLQCERDQALEGLRWYADQFCEFGIYSEACGKLNSEQCSGCLARATLTGVMHDAE